KMIEHEALPRESSDEVDGSRQLPTVNQDVVGEIEILQHRDASTERGTQKKPVVRLALHDVPHSYELRMRRDLLQLRPDVVCLQVHPADHPDHERVGVRE